MGRFKGRECQDEELHTRQAAPQVLSDACEPVFTSDRSAPTRFTPFAADGAGGGIVSSVWTKARKAGE
jgi:hypothetical protein